MTRGSAHQPPAFALSAEVSARGVALTARAVAGRILGVLGPNGAGKSTLIELLAGTLCPDHGWVELAGQRVAAEGHVQVPTYARSLAVLSQRPLLFPHLSVLENVAFGPRAHGMKKPAARARARQELSAMGVADLADRRPYQLSGGQAQRVAIARALAADPELVLLDEPLAALDVAVATPVRHLLRERIRQSRTSVVLVTHDLLDVLALADDLLVIADGTCVEAGPAATVLTHPRSPFAAQFAGLNLLLGQVREEAVLELADLQVQGRVVGEPLTIGESALAAFSPQAVAVFTAPPKSSVRNIFPGQVRTIAPTGSFLRVTVQLAGTEVAAECTPAAALELELQPGSEVFLAVKAAQVSLYPR